MNFRVRALGVWLLLTVFGMAVVAWAQSMQENYKPVRSAPSFFRTSLDGTDSETYSATPVAARASFNDTTLVVVPRHSASTSTAQIEVGLYFRSSSGTYSFMGVADVQTSTSTAKTDGTGYYPNRPLYFALNGAHYFDLRCTDVSTGTVDLKAWTIGAASAAAE